MREIAIALVTINEYNKNTILQTPIALSFTIDIFTAEDDTSNTE
jgi:hypothetical protein